MLRRIGALVALVSLILSGAAVLPGAIEAWIWLDAARDPVRLVDLRLDRELTVDRASSDIGAALAADDPDLAASHLALADARGISVDPALRARVDAASEVPWTDSAGAFLRGAVVGDDLSLAGLAGATAGDLVGIGDVRDLSREGAAWLRGDDPDELMVGLAVVGLAVTGATWGSAGALAPVRAGVTAVKTAKRIGRLSAPLAATVSRLAGKVLDGPGARRALDAALRLDLPAARIAAREGLSSVAGRELVRFAADGGTIARRAGVRTLDESLALARSPAEIAGMAKLAERHGDGTRAVLRMFGRGAVTLIRAILELLGWIYAAAAWFLSLAFAAAAFGRWLARATRRSPARTSAPPGTVPGRGDWFVRTA